MNMRDWSWLAATVALAVASGACGWALGQARLGPPPVPESHAGCWAAVKALEADLTEAKARHVEVIRETWVPEPGSPGRWRSVRLAEGER